MTTPIQCLSSLLAPKAGRRSSTLPFIAEPIHVSQKNPIQKGARPRSSSPSNEKNISSSSHLPEFFQKKLKQESATLFPSTVHLTEKPLVSLPISILINKNIVDPATKVKKNVQWADLKISPSSTVEKTKPRQEPLPVDPSPPTSLSLQSLLDIVEKANQNSARTIASIPCREGKKSAKTSSTPFFPFSLNSSPISPSSLTPSPTSPFSLNSSPTSPSSLTPSSTSSSSLNFSPTRRPSVSLLLLKPQDSPLFKRRAAVKKQGRLK